MILGGHNASYFIQVHLCGKNTSFCKGIVPNC